MQVFKIKSVLPAIVGAVVGTIGFTALPSHAGTIVNASFNNGVGGNIGDSINLVGNTITVNETFNQLNTIRKDLTVQSGGSGVYNFVVNALNSNTSPFTWSSFRFNLNVTGSPTNRPTFSAQSSDRFSEFVGGGNNGFLEFVNGTVLPGQTAQFLFSLTVPTGYNDSFSIDERPFGASSAAVPTPAVIPAMIGFGAGILRKRRQNKNQLA